MKLLSILASCLGLLCLLGCAEHRPYVQAQLPPFPASDTNHNCIHSIIEFDDQGELWDRRQLTATLSAIEQLTNRPVVLLVYMHGWKHNAISSNAMAFHQFSSEFGEALPGTPGMTNFSVVSVYLAWRGRVLQSRSKFENFSFYNRLTAAVRVGGLSCTEALFSLIGAVRNNDYVRSGSGDHSVLSFSEQSKVFIIGHSMGGLIVEEALTKPLLGAILANGPKEREARRLINELQRTNAVIRGNLENLRRTNEVIAQGIQEIQRLLDTTSQTLESIKSQQKRDDTTLSENQKNQNESTVIQSKLPTLKKELDDHEQHAKTAEKSVEQNEERFRSFLAFAWMNGFLKQQLDWPKVSSPQDTVAKLAHLQQRTVTLSNKMHSVFDFQISETSHGAVFASAADSLKFARSEFSAVYTSGRTARDGWQTFNARIDSYLLSNQWSLAKREMSKDEDLWRPLLETIVVIERSEIPASEVEAKLKDAKTAVRTIFQARASGTNLRWHKRLSMAISALANKLELIRRLDFSPKSPAPQFVLTELKPDNSLENLRSILEDIERFTPFAEGLSVWLIDSQKEHNSQAKTQLQQRRENLHSQVGLALAFLDQTLPIAQDTLKTHTDLQKQEVILEAKRSAAKDVVAAAAGRSGEFLANSNKLAGVVVTNQTAMERLERAKHDADSKIERFENKLSFSLGRIEDEKRAIRPLPADLVLLVNPASSGLAAKKMITALKEPRSQEFLLRRPASLPGAEGGENQNWVPPLMIAVSSKADRATSKAFPFAQGVTSLMRNFRGPDPVHEEEFYRVDFLRRVRSGTFGTIEDTRNHSAWMPNQSVFAAHTAPNIPEILSHNVYKVGDSALYGNKSSFGVLRKNLKANVVPNLLASYEFQTPSSTYRISPRIDAWNDTPYWVLQAPEELLPSHNDLWTAEFYGLLTGLFRISTELQNSAHSGMEAKSLQVQVQRHSLTEVAEAAGPSVSE
jgi:hypothetical protein